MKTNKSPQELSYYRLSLQSFLQESHPELSNNTEFINVRADLAVESYSNAIKEGHSQQEAEELANEVLYLGLHFSKHDLLVNILWNEFSDFVPQSQAKEFAVRILSECNLIFNQYALSNEFADTPQYDKLYTELTGFIDSWLEEHEL